MTIRFSLTKTSATNEPLRVVNVVALDSNQSAADVGRLDFELSFSTARTKPGRSKDTCE
jgi:hypothetical protein